MKKATRSSKAKGVCRIDDPGRHGVGWYARVTFQGRTYSKYFADGSHGGKKKAFEKAVIWRDEKEKELGKPRTDRVISSVSSRNRSGVPGVYRDKESYVVAWSPAPGEVRRQFVSIPDLGEEGALRRAVEIRRRREREMYGRMVTTKSMASAARPVKRRKPKPRVVTKKKVTRSTKSTKAAPPARSRKAAAPSKSKKAASASKSTKRAR